MQSHAMLRDGDMKTLVAGHRQSELSQTRLWHRGHSSLLLNCDNCWWQLAQWDWSAVPKTSCCCCCCCFNCSTSLCSCLLRHIRKAVGYGNVFVC